MTDTIAAQMRLVVSLPTGGQVTGEKPEDWAEAVAPARRKPGGDSTSVKAGLALTVTERADRYKAMAELKQRGYSNRQIGQVFNLSAERVRVILAQGPGLGRWAPINRLETKRVELVEKIRKSPRAKRRPLLRELESIEDELAAERRDIELLIS